MSGKPILSPRSPALIAINDASVFFALVLVLLVDMRIYLLEVFHGHVYQ
jgi:hypothetical protein